MNPTKAVYLRGQAAILRSSLRRWEDENQGYGKPGKTYHKAFIPRVY